MYNDIFTIGGVTVHGYGLMIGLGVLCAVFVSTGRKKGFNTDQVFTIFLLVLIFGFIGAKLLFCLVNIKAVIADPVLILSGDGFVVYGGIVAGIASVIVYCRVKN